MTVQHEIERQLSAHFAPVHLDVANESSQHNVPANSETHFRVVLVSEQFEGLRKVGRHQRVYQVLAAQLEGPVHALALHTYTPAEWQARQQEAPGSPACLGGGRSAAE